MFLFAAIAALCGCNILENGYFPLDGRTARDRTYGNSGRDSSATAGHTDPVIPADTVIWCTAVRFPKSYDWQKDTAWGSAECEVLLLRDGKEIICVPGGKGREASSAADMHHLIGSNLYTEYSSMDETVIKMDGLEILRFSGREMLKGLVFLEGDWYTLTTGRYGDGFTLRCNSDVLLRKQVRVGVFGSLGDPSYPETGALYEDDDGRITFCYRESGVSMSYRVVRDGTDSTVEYKNPGKILDMKFIGDSLLYVSSDSYGFAWDDARIPFDSPTFVTGHIGGASVVYDCSTGRMKALCGTDATIYCNADAAAALVHPTCGKYSIFYSNGDCRTGEDNCNFFTCRCAGLVGDVLATAVSPLEKGRTPYIDFGDRKEELKELGNGFISGFRIEVSQSN